MAAVLLPWGLPEVATLSGCGVLLCHFPGHGSDFQENALGKVRRCPSPSCFPASCLPFPTVGVAEHKDASPFPFSKCLLVLPRRSRPSVTRGEWVAPEVSPWTILPPPW